MTLNSCKDMQPADWALDQNPAQKPSVSATVALDRLSVRGKFLFAGEEKFFVRGVTYGTFRPNAQGEEFPEPAIVERDFAKMAANEVNAVRTYTPPPGWLLAAAQRHGLRIMAGLPVERSVAFLDYHDCARAIEEMVRTEVR